MDTLLLSLGWNSHRAIGCTWPLLWVLIIVVMLSGWVSAQSRPAILPWSIHREAAMPGWIPGQWNYPANLPRPDMQWTWSLGGRYHPAVSALSEIVLSAGYISNKDWLTLGISRQGTTTVSRHQMVIGYSKSLYRNRAGLSLQWNRTAHSLYRIQNISACIGSEQALGAHWRIGFGLQHPMILQGKPMINPRADAIKEPAQGLNLGLYGVMELSPWLIQGTTQFSQVEGWRNELGVVYRRSSGMGIVFSADPVNTLFNLGICYAWDRNSLWTSTLYSPLPGLCYQMAWEGGIP